PFDEKSLRSGLAEVIKAGLLAPQAHGPKGEYYVFKHELVRDAAYDSLLKSKRQSLHLEIAKIIRSEREKYSDMRPELIAYHYTAAGLATEAAPLWLEAGQLALRESAIREARSNLQKGLECLRELPESKDTVRLELRLQSCLGQSLIAIAGHGSADV